MTSVTISVAATWRLSRVEFDTPHNAAHNVLGYGEVLLEEPEEELSGSQILRSQATAETKVYGTMPGAKVTRDIAAVMDDTVYIGDGTLVSFSAVMEALPQFFEKWRVEDLEAPPVPEATMAIPPPAHFSPMPIGTPIPEDELTPPKGIGV